MIDRFTESDLSILLAMPSGETTVERILMSYVHMHRSAPPGYDSFQQFMKKASRAGIVSIVDSKNSLKQSIWNMVRDSEASVMHDWDDTVDLVLPKLNAIAPDSTSIEKEFWMAMREYEVICRSVSSF